MAEQKEGAAAKVRSAAAKIKDEVKDEVKSVKEEIWVLERNFGLIIDRVHKFWEQGTEISAVKEVELLALLRRFGASLKLKK